jgi:hypothetical protein
MLQTWLGKEDEGRLLGAATWENHGMNEALVAEAQALYNSMTLAADVCFTAMVFEMKCQIP